jgi:molybdate transport system permease protein
MGPTGSAGRATLGPRIDPFAPSLPVRLSVTAQIRAPRFPRAWQLLYCWLLVGWGAVAPAFGGQESEPLVIHAASSLRGVCEQLAQSYSSLRPEIDLRFNFGASNDLAGQIAGGAPGNLFLSADVRQIERLGGAAYTYLCSNRLVVVEPAQDSQRLEGGLKSAADLDGARRISMAEPSAVPAGIYARTWLESIGAWERLQRKVVPAIDARAALAAVESGACEAGILYGTDARHSQRVHVAFEVPANQQPAIRYGVTLLGSEPQPEAARFMGFLLGPAGRALLEQHGFVAEAPTGEVPFLSSGPVRSPWLPLWISLKVAGCATLLVFLPGIWLGWCLARKRFFGRSIVETLVALPLVLPPTAIGYLLLRSFAAGAGLDLLLSWKGAVVAASVMSLPLVVRTARVAFEGVDPRLESMGASLGWSPGQVLWRVSLPLARRGLVAGAILAFSRALGEFGATVIVAGNIPGETQTLALAIFQDIQLGREDRAMQLLGVSVVLAFIGMWSVECLMGKDRKRVEGDR